MSELERTLKRVERLKKINQFLNNKKIMIPIAILIMVVCAIVSCVLINNIIESDLPMWLKVFLIR